MEAITSVVLTSQGLESEVFYICGCAFERRCTVVVLYEVNNVVQREHPGEFPCVLVVERCRYDTCVRLLSSVIGGEVKERRTILEERRKSLLYLELRVENEQSETKRECVISASALEK